MEIIVGLGNPGSQYRDSRHNVGFQVIDRLAEHIIGQKFKWKKGFSAQVINHHYKGKDLILVKPQTFMNLSGKSVREVVTFYKINYNHLLIVYDDFNLPLGKLRIRERGSSGGHHGMDSIINNLQSNDFPRIRIGIRNEELLENLDYSSFVLAKFLPEEKDLMENTIIRATLAVEDILNNGYQFAMREYNC